MSKILFFPARRIGKTFTREVAIARRQVVMGRIAARRHQIVNWTVEVTSAALDGRISDEKAIALLDVLDRQAMRLNRFAEGLGR